MAATEAQKAAARRYYWNHREKCLAARAEYVRTKPDYLMRRYGLTLGDYEQMYAKQNGQCAICGIVVQGERMCVDHDHSTGEVRGLLCRGCNSALGKFHDSVDVLQRAIAYLKREA